MHITHAPMPVVIWPRLDRAQRYCACSSTRIEIWPFHLKPDSSSSVIRQSPRATARHDDARPPRVLRRRHAVPPDAPAWKDFGSPMTHSARRSRPSIPSRSPGLSRVLSHLRRALRQEPLGDKTPLYCLHIDAIASLLPEAHFIHLIRDGRDARWCGSALDELGGR